MKQFPVRKHPRLPRPVYREGHIFFLTCSTYRRHPWFERIVGTWVYPRPAADELPPYRMADERGTEIFAWCFMPDHCHLLVQGEDMLEGVQKARALNILLCRAVVYPQPIPVMKRDSAGH